MYVNVMNQNNLRLGLVYTSTLNSSYCLSEPVRVCKFRKDDQRVKVLLIQRLGCHVYRPEGNLRFVEGL